MTKRRIGNLQFSNLLEHTMKNIDVECRFEGEERIVLCRIRLGDRWEPVVQGRQWQDERGHHFLVMRHNQVYTVTFNPIALSWTITPVSTQRSV